MNDDKNGRQPKWNMTKMEDDQIGDNPNGRIPKWKKTKMEDDQKKDDQNGRRPNWKTTKMEDNKNGRRPICYLFISKRGSNWKNTVTIKLI